MKLPAKMLVIYVDETDLWGTGSLYEAIVRRLRQLGLAGATAQAAISMGLNLFAIPLL